MDTDSAPVDANSALEMAIARQCEVVAREEGREISEAEKDEIRQTLKAQTPEGREQSREFLIHVQHENMASGMQGGLALLHAIVRNCPGLDKERRRELKAGIIDPVIGDVTEPINKRGGFRVRFMRDGQPAELMLHVGPAPASHDLSAELAKIEPYLGEADKERLREQMGYLMQFARQVYAALLGSNRRMLVDDLGEHLNGFNPLALHIDNSNTTWYLEGPDGAAWEPRCGLFLS